MSTTSNGSINVYADDKGLSSGAAYGGFAELSVDELDLVLGGSGPSGVQQESGSDSSGGFQQGVSNVADAGGVGVIVGGVAGATIGALGGSFAGPAGTMAGAMGGAEIGALAGGALAASAATGWELGSAYPEPINAVYDAFAASAEEYQNNPPPI